VLKLQHNSFDYGANIRHWPNPPHRSIRQWQEALRRVEATCGLVRRIDDDSNWANFRLFTSRATWLVSKTVIFSITAVCIHGLNPESTS
jgi:hypothetical protein